MCGQSKVLMEGCTSTQTTEIDGDVHDMYMIMRMKATHCSTKRISINLWKGHNSTDLLTNLPEAFKQAPNHYFQRGHNMRVDMWSTNKQIDWQPDGT
jgi:hypothetical protein